MQLLLNAMLPEPNCSSSLLGKQIIHPPIAFNIVCYLSFPNIALGLWSFKSADDVYAKSTRLQIQKFYAEEKLYLAFRQDGS